MMIRHPKTTRTHAARGAILLEVVLAMTLFVFGAAAVATALSRSLDSARRLRIRARAADLAVTTVSEIQMGVLPLERVEPTYFDEVDLRQWTWAVAVEPLEQIESMRVLTVTVAHEPTGVYHTLSQWVAAPEDELDL